MANATEAIAGFFRTRGEGEAAQQALLSGGFSRDEVSFVAGDTSGHTTPAIGPIRDVGADSEAGKDAWVGSAVGFAAGMIALVLPGIGPLIAAGPLAGAIAGMGAGFATGGIIGLLREHGISEDEAQFYAEGVKRGGALVTVHDISGNRAGEARKILKHHGAIDTENLTRSAG